MWLTRVFLVSMVMFLVTSQIFEKIALLRELFVTPASTLCTYCYQKSQSLPRMCAPEYIRQRFYARASKYRSCCCEHRALYSCRGYPDTIWAKVINFEYWRPNSNVCTELSNYVCPTESDVMSLTNLKSNSLIVGECSPSPFSECISLEAPNSQVLYVVQLIHTCF